MNSANQKTQNSVVTEADLNSIMRRVDCDGDEMISFQDFFSSLLPYFVYGDFRPEPNAFEQKENENKNLKKKLNKHRKVLNS